MQATTPPSSSCNLYPSNPWRRGWKTSTRRKDSSNSTTRRRVLTLNLRFNYSIKEEGREGRVDKQQPDNHTPPPRNFSRGENIELKGGGKIEGFVEAISSSPQIWKRFEGGWKIYRLPTHARFEIIFYNPRKVQSYHGKSGIEANLEIFYIILSFLFFFKDSAKIIPV